LLKPKKNKNYVFVFTNQAFVMSLVSDESRLDFDVQVGDLIYRQSMVRSRNKVRYAGVWWWIGLQRDSGQNIGIYLFRNGTQQITVSFYFRLRNSDPQKAVSAPKDALEDDGNTFEGAFVDESKGHGCSDLINHDILVNHANGFLHFNGNAVVSVHIVCESFERLKLMKYGKYGFLHTA
jgi:hypothetical protein